MKKAFQTILGAGLVLAFLASCVPAFLPYTAPLSGDEATLYTDTNTALQATTGGTSFVVSAGDATGTENWTGQRMRLSFSNGIVDAASVAAAVAIYPLADAASADEVYVRGAALAFTSEVRHGAAATDSDVFFTVDLTSVITDWIEIAISPTLLTANTGTKTLDTDADGIPGEVEDEYVLYVAVAQSTAPTALAITLLATGQQRNPQAPITVAGYATAAFLPPDGTAALAWAAPNFFADTSGGPAAENIDAAGVAGAIAVEQMGADVDTWTAVAMGTPDNTTGPTFAYTFATAPTTEGAIFRVTMDLYRMTESAATLGYTHRGTYDQYDEATRYDINYVFIGAGGSGWETLAPITPAAGGSQYRRYFDVNFGGPEVKIASISTDSVRLVHQGTGRVFPWESFAVLTGAGSPDAGEVRFFMPISFDPVIGQNFRVQSTPVLKNGDDDPSTDTVDEADPYGSQTDPYTETNTFSW